MHNMKPIFMMWILSAILLSLTGIFLTTFIHEMSELSLVEWPSQVHREHFVIDAVLLHIALHMGT